MKRSCSILHNVLNNQLHHRHAHIKQGGPFDIYSVLVKWICTISTDILTKQHLDYHKSGSMKIELSINVKLQFIEFLNKFSMNNLNRYVVSDFVRSLGSQNCDRRKLSGSSLACHACNDKELDKSGKGWKEVRRECVVYWGRGR